MLPETISVGEGNLLCPNPDCPGITTNVPPNGEVKRRTPLRYKGRVEVESRERVLECDSCGMCWKPLVLAVLRQFVVNSDETKAFGNH